MSEFPRTLKIITVWLLIGLAVFLGMQWLQAREARTRWSVQADGVIEIRRGADGHYHWPGRVNGREVDFLIDTGATGTALSSALARALELPQVGRMRTQTAGGVVEAAVVRADIELEGGVRVRQLRVAALPGLGERPLLGMDVLGRLHWRQRNGVLLIEPGPAGH